jgi:hypothetical protein
MGLDWRPIGKPKPGFEERYNQIFHIIEKNKEKELRSLDKPKGKKLKIEEELLEEWFANTTPAYEAIKAPRVGRDKLADDWILGKYEESDKSLSQEEFIKHHQGYYVIELAEELEGVPMYVAMRQDENVFRGQFLNDCEDLIGQEILKEAWNSKLAVDTLIYGLQLLAIADKIATENNLLYLKDQRLPPNTDVDSIESKIHILYSAAKWLIFYGKNGHGYEADF